jgi:hypothetical protein
MLLRPLPIACGWTNIAGGARDLRHWAPMAEHHDPERSDPVHTVRETVEGLVAPRRLVPILLVCAPMVVAQGRLSGPGSAPALGAAMCVAFVLVAPVSWRLLMPDGVRGPGVWGRLLVYGAIGFAAVFGVGVGIPALLGIGVTFLTAKVSLAISVALFLVGGWGLGRDIGFEHRLRRERRRSEALAREAERAQLLALRAQLDPHFLFNTLNSIAEWCREDGVVAERAVLQLSAMLRSVLVGVKAQTWPLRQELELVETLFALHRLRDPGLFDLAWSVDASLAEVPVPPLILLPLAENATKHGPCAGHRGRVRFAVSEQSRDVLVEIENPGQYAGPRPGSSGLPNLQRRLELAYDGKARLQVASKGGGTVASLRLPKDGPRAGVVT